uniref:DUF834 domain-containing protein n=1 Tax=Oryza barthii TaxID=65489 RepID=A0A0D3GMA4_9ORYZ
MEMAARMEGDDEQCSVAPQADPPAPPRTDPVRAELAVVVGLRGSRRQRWRQRRRARGDNDGCNGAELVAKVVAAAGRRRQHGDWSTALAAAGYCGNGWRPARHERCGWRRGGRLGVRGAADGGRPDWRERRVRWWRRPAWRDEARPVVKEATMV